MTPSTGIVVTIICILVFTAIVGYFFSWVVKREVLKALGQREETTEASSQSGRSEPEPLAKIEVIKVTRPNDSAV
ncbi:hypothetical protein V8F20_003362 [Naviculisporaceae sp. PSN 640]